MLTQIYEVSTPSEADAISGLGIDHVGVLVGNGAFPRERSARQAIAVIAATRASSKSSALFLSADIALIEQMARELRPTIIHLGASTELLRPKTSSIYEKCFEHPVHAKRAGDRIWKHCDRQELRWDSRFSIARQPSRRRCANWRAGYYS